MKSIDTDNNDIKCNLKPKIITLHGRFDFYHLKKLFSMSKQKNNISYILYSN